MDSHPFSQAIGWKLAHNNEVALEVNGGLELVRDAGQSEAGGQLLAANTADSGIVGAG